MLEGGALVAPQSRQTLPVAAAFRLRAGRASVARPALRSIHAIVYQSQMTFEHKSNTHSDMRKGKKNYRCQKCVTHLSTREFELEMCPQ